LLDLLGLDRDDEVQIRIEKQTLIVERADEVATAEKRRAQLDKAKARMHAKTSEGPSEVHLAW